MFHNGERQQEFVSGAGFLPSPATAWLPSVMTFPVTPQLLRGVLQSVSQGTCVSETRLLTDLEDTSV